MNRDSWIDSDLQALAESTMRKLPTIEQTARELEQAQAQPTGGRFMKIIRQPMWASVAAAAVVALVLLCPVPYTRTAGYLLTVRRPGGREAQIRLATHDAAQAERRAAVLRSRGATVTLAARRERVWGSVYAMAKDKLLQIRVDTDGKSDAQVADEIRAQLQQAGWNADDVQVQRDADGSTVELSAEDGAGRKMKIVREAKGGPEQQIDFLVDGIGELREPGMTDAQLRDKILKQLQERGLDADVKVEGGRVEVRAQQEIEKP